MIEIRSRRKYLVPLLISHSQTMSQYQILFHVYYNEKVIVLKVMKVRFNRRQTYNQINVVTLKGRYF